MSASVAGRTGFARRFVQRAGRLERGSAFRYQRWAQELQREQPALSRVLHVLGEEDRRHQQELAACLPLAAPLPAPPPIQAIGLPGPSSAAVLARALVEELAAERFYRNAGRHLAPGPLHSLFLRLAEETAVQVRVLRELRERWLLLSAEDLGALPRRGHGT